MIQFEEAKCKICEKEFDSAKSLNIHIKKDHSIYLKDYYEKYYKRVCPYSLLVIPYKNFDSYFSSFFFCDLYINKYFDKNWNTEDGRKLALEILSSRIKLKDLKTAPTYLEVKSLKMPTVEIYSKMFGSYGAACRKIGVDMLFKGKLKEDINKNYSEKEILIDTREQKPLKFKNSIVTKIDVGDYTLCGEEFTRTFIDRKSESDFKGTLSSGYERFRRELERCRTLGCFLFVVTEAKLENMERNNNFGAHASNLSYVFHNMRKLQHDFSDCCQFVFSGNRKNSEILIPKLLSLGEEVWNVDIQYYLEKGFINELDRG